MAHNSTAFYKSAENLEVNFREQVVDNPVMCRLRVYFNNKSIHNYYIIFTKECRGSASKNELKL